MAMSLKAGSCVKVALCAGALMMMSVPALPQTITPVAAASAKPAAAVRKTPETGQVRLLVGRSVLINVGAPIARVSLTLPDVADAMVTSPRQLLVHGKAPGTISLFVWDRDGEIATYDVVVQRDLSSLDAQFRQLFPGEPVSVSSNGKDIVLSGTVSSKYIVDKAADVAAGYVEKKENVVNLLRQIDTEESVQVLLRVRFAEVSRSGLQELGVSLFADGANNLLGRTSTQQFPAPFFDKKIPMVNEHLVFSDYLNLFLFDAKSQLGAVVKALQTKGLFQSLAEPNLIALNGQEASFLAGGEYPYPAVQGGATGIAISVLFKEFGIRLSFTPTVIKDDLIHLKVKPEVSALDFTNAVSIQGFRVPALTTRRAETQVELRDGQTFAIAGLLNHNLTETMQKMPGIGDIPILGLLFRSRAVQKAETELVVMITPHIMRRGSPGVTSELPRLDKPYMTPPQNTLPSPPAVPLVPQPAAPAYPPAALSYPSGGFPPIPSRPFPEMRVVATTDGPDLPAITRTGIAPIVQAPAPTFITPAAEQRKVMERARKADEQNRKNSQLESSRGDFKPAKSAQRPQPPPPSESARLMR